MSDHIPSVNTIFAVKSPRKTEFRSAPTQIYRAIPPNLPNADSDAQSLPKQGEKCFSPSNALIKLDLRFWFGGIPFGIIARLRGSLCQLPQRWPACRGDSWLLG